MVSQASSSTKSNILNSIGSIQTGILQAAKDLESHWLLSSKGVAGVGRTSPNLADLTNFVNDDVHESHRESNVSKEESDVNSTQMMQNAEPLQSTPSTVSFTELVEFVPQSVRTSKEQHPDKKILISVHNFFRYTEAEGKQLFEELDRDGDGQVTLGDLEVAMRKRNLPRKYARFFFHRTRSHLFSKSFGWKQFLSLIKQKEPTILQAYNNICLSESGKMDKNHILTSLKILGLTANEDNATAMLKSLDKNATRFISYGQFRNFMLLLPSEHLEQDQRIWFETSTSVSAPSHVEITTSSVLKSALAGGLSCALSNFIMHPVDTLKTRVQASTLSFSEVIAKLPQIGLRGLYKGSLPAIIGQFSGHALRTGFLEVSKLVLVNVAPALPDIQVQSISSFSSTILGTVARVPSEVLKQRLQAGMFDNVGEVFVCTIHQDGLKGFFRGTGAMLCREVPFYVAGMGLYAEAKKAAHKLLKRELKSYEVIVVGALSGGFVSVATTPFDVIKTRMMTSHQGQSVSMSMVAISIIREEGLFGLFKGAVPRFLWIAPLGAMNFSGCELLRKSMDCWI